MRAVALVASLPPARKYLVSLMQEIRFGRIEGLPFRNGEPVVDSPPRVVREIKFGGENGPHPKAGCEDFALKGQVCELFVQLEALGDGIILCLQIRHGLPFKMDVERNAAE